MGLRTLQRSRMLASTIAAVVAMSACGGGGGDAGGWPSIDVVAVPDSSTISTGEIVGDGVTVVSLWATWCGPCKKELPMLQTLADEGTATVGINIGDEADAVAAFLDDYGISFPTYIDVDGELMTALDVASVPATLILSDGEVVWENKGAVEEADVRAQLDALGA